MRLFEAKREEIKSEEELEVHDKNARFFESEIDKKIKMTDELLKEPQIPEYFNCVFTQCLMDDPCATKAGISYSKEHIVEHVRMRQDDPVTRTRVLLAEIYPNTALAKGIERFKHSYPFAEDINLDI